MNEYELGRDVQSILSRLDAIEATLYTNGTRVDRPESREAEVAAVIPDVLVESGPLVFRFNPWAVDNIVFDGTVFTLYEPGQWVDVCPCKNVSRHSNWRVTHGLLLKRATGEELFRIRCWYGRFGAGYSETKRATGANLLIHDYWPQLISAEVQIWQWMEAIRV
jgi:hypothetical protein